MHMPHDPQAGEGQRLGTKGLDGRLQYPALSELVNRPHGVNPKFGSIMERLPSHGKFSTQLIDNMPRFTELVLYINLIDL